jgi:hypothetical protein
LDFHFVWRIFRPLPFLTGWLFSLSPVLMMETLYQKIKIGQQVFYFFFWPYSKSRANFFQKFPKGHPDYPRAIISKIKQFNGSGKHGLSARKNSFQIKSMGLIQIKS